jgi:hypothetical protein
VLSLTCFTPDRKNFTPLIGKKVNLLGVIPQGSQAANWLKREGKESILRNVKSYN